MFKKEYVFYGKHADLVKALTTKISQEYGVAIFNRNIDVLLFSPIIGIVYGRRAEVDRKSNSTTKIFTETMIKESESLNYIYELIMLLYNKENEDIETRLDRAFRYVTKSDEFRIECKSIFDSYVLGGIEVMHEKIVEGASDGDEYLSNLYEFLEEFNLKYNVAEVENDYRKYY